MQTHEILFNQRVTNGTVTKQHESDTNERNDSDNELNETMSDPISEPVDEDHKIKFLDWGFKVDRLFEVAYRFYKRNENKAFHLGFDERNRMIALVMQARFGNFDDGKAPDIGVLDLVGKRRQNEWSLLKGMTKTEAMTKFICELDDVCPIFKAHAEAVKISSGFESQINHNVTSENGTDKLVRNSGDSATFDPSAQLSGVYTSLCKQTHNQFKSYAEKQHPGDSIKQKLLISSLQEQYYQQYMSQMNPKLRDGPLNASHSNSQSSNTISSMPSPSTSHKSSDGVSTASIKSESNNEPIRINDRPKDEQTTSIETPLNNDQSRQEERLINMSDTNCEEDNVQADISCEELNSELNFEPAAISTREEASRITPTNESGSLTPASHSKPDETTELNLVETVRLGQNFDLPPVAMFESFPEPKLVQDPGTKKLAPIELIDPNLPNRTMQIKTNQDNISNDKTTPSSEMVPNRSSQLDNDQEAAKNYDRAPEYTSKQDPNDSMEQGFPPVPEAYSHNENQHFGVDQCDTSFEKACQNEDHVADSHEPLNDQSEGKPPFWEPTGSSDGCSPVDLHSTFTYEPLEPASIWTKRAVNEFKESLGGDKQSGVYEIKEGALIVIQVPTYPDGKYIYWEFATDNYDIGFGLDFVHDRHLEEPLALNIYQDNDDDDLEILADSDSWQTNPTEAAEYCQSRLVSERDRSIAEKRERLMNTVSILPTYRRDSHEEVFVGRHKYPGRGYYLLKFDNTYSVLRSKTLYFRICYFM